jgi:DNA-binding XRE family transcriptional regulator
MEVAKINEKLIVWMFRTARTQQDLAKELGTTRQTLAGKIKNNHFEDKDLLTLKSLGFNW